MKNLIFLLILISQASYAKTVVGLNLWHMSDDWPPRVGASLQTRAISIEEIQNNCLNVRCDYWVDAKNFKQDKIVGKFKISIGYFQYINTLEIQVFGTDPNGKELFLGRMSLPESLIPTLGQHGQFDGIELNAEKEDGMPNGLTYMMMKVFFKDIN